jgi:CheY-like chemotaxis protein
MDGIEAVAAAQRKDYDVILMDCQMPRLDGCESTRRIRQHEAGRSHRTWIIAMTAHSLVGDRERCIEAGMDDYLSKPVRLRDIAEALERCPCASRMEHEGQPAWADAVSQEKITGFRDMEQESGRPVLDGIISLFIETTPPLFRQIRAAVAGNDAPRIGRLAHTLKGSCSNFGAERMRAACEKLEAIARDGDADVAGEALEQVEREFGFVRAALEHELPAKAS